MEVLCAHVELYYTCLEMTNIKLRKQSNCVMVDLLMIIHIQRLLESTRVAGKLL